MLGKPGWFRERRVGRGLTPVRWQGWMHSAFWGVAILVPFLVLLFSRGAIEALIWGVAGCTALMLEVRQLRKAIRAADLSDVLIIDEETADEGHVATEKFEMDWGVARR